MLFNERPVVVSRRLCYVILCVPVSRSYNKERNKAVVVVVKAASCCFPVTNTQSKSLGCVSRGNIEVNVAVPIAFPPAITVVNSLIFNNN